METSGSTSPEDAARALTEIADARRRADAVPTCPPRWYGAWYGALISLYPVAGGLLGAGQRTSAAAVSLLCVVGLGVLIGTYQATRQAQRRVRPDRRTVVVTTTGALVLVASYALGWLSTARWHLVWPVVALAAATAVAGIALVRSKTR